ncbi:hypothetical protein ABV409_15005 [Flagellimonas sp. DF-77]|uniref:hypothetical protein n=1 Tax=Flagellimonas algarum TaxID=3230298 RepID=UPI003398ABED
MKKIKASSLMETLAATVLLVLLFMMASMVMNSVFLNSISQHDRAIRETLHQLQYRHAQGQLPLPYVETVGAWQVEVRQGQAGETVYQASHENGAAQILLTSFDATNY